MFVVIPARQEGNRLPKTLRKLGLGKRVLVAALADDAQTLAAAKAGGARVALSPPGKGAALRAGEKQCPAGNMLMLDADAPLAVPRDIDALTKGLAPREVRIGSRILPGGLRRRPWLRRLVSAAFRVLTRLMVGLPHTDTQCGAKAFGKEAREVFAHSAESGFAIDLELLLLCRARGFMVREVPVSWHDVGESRVRIVRDSLRMFWALIRLAARRIRGDFSPKQATR